MYIKPATSEKRNCILPPMQLPLYTFTRPSVHSICSFAFATSFFLFWCVHTHIFPANTGHVILRADLPPTQSSFPNTYYPSSYKYTLKPLRDTPMDSFDVKNPFINYPVVVIN